MTDHYDDYLDAGQSRFIDELSAFLSIPSVSSDPQRIDDVFAAAHWVCARLSSAGVPEARVLRAGHYPMVYGAWLGAPGAPTVLIYGHFDVQPAEGQPGWLGAPFEPAIRDGRIYARGATDDKGNMLAPIVAIETLLRCDGRLPVNVKFLFEGEEEILSPDLPAFIEAHRELLACDCVLSADGWQWSESEADLRLSLRGVCALDVKVTGSCRDLHSGSYGGAVANPVRGLVSILGSLHDADGRIAVPGFLDAVREFSANERARLARIPLDDAAFRNRAGVPEVAGEAGYSTLERIGMRPTIEINGIVGGHTGEGVRTIIPASAQAKLTCRLVPDQEPETIAHLLKTHIEAQSLPGLAVSAEILPNAASPYAIDYDHPVNLAAREVLYELYGREPYYTRSGGSIPILALFQRVLGVSTVIFGFGLPDENMHGPNEYLRLSGFRLGQRAYVDVLRRIQKA
ncbi:dipeptidase [Paraburkholderia tropica]|uniref:dipeptidase n=1 Tax=Paraburkholderia tropica TaxID=92647 RepID=UPI002AB67FD1|nr:dipeptidase [Paraburkholderia tropica]